MDIKKILEDHKAWIETNEKEGKRANLQGAYLQGADLSQTKGLLTAKDYLKQFKSNKKNGIYVYKAFGNTAFQSPNHWKISEGEYLEEICNPDRGAMCACGVNFASLEWCKDNYSNSTYWLCLIEWADLCGVVVPFNTDGKARCERLKLIKKVK